MKSKTTKLLSLIISILLSAAIICVPITAQARELTEYPSAYRNYPNEVYLIQQETDSCTVAASAMMVRARFYMSGNNKWRTITESAVRSKAMLEGVGLRWEWTYANGSDSVSVGHDAYDSGMTFAQVKSMLKAHPEGFVLYTWSPHAVFVTDIVGNTIYCADPADYIGGKRVKLEQSWLGDCHGSQSSILSAVIATWYVKSYSVSGTPISYSESDIIANEVVPELVNNSYLSSTTVNIGTSVTIRGAASGGNGGYKYEYYFKKASASSWTLKQGYSSESSVSFKPSAATKYNIKVNVKDANGTVATKTMTLTVKELPELVNSSTVNATTINLGETVTVSAAASGGTGSYQYAYYFKKASASDWVTKQSYSSTRSVTFKPSTATAYNFKVSVKDSNGTVVSKIFTITAKARPALVNSATISSTSINLGDTLTITAAASGGTGTYQYAFYFKQSSASSYSTKQSYSSVKSVTLKPSTATTYNIKVNVKDSNGTVTSKVFNVSVKAWPELVNNSKVSATTITLGQTINITGAAAGGTGTYQYAYYFKQASASGWTTKQSYGSSTGVSLKPSTATTYNIKVNVKDSNGTVKSKTFTVKVNAAPALVNNSTISSTSINLGNTVTINGAASGGFGSYQYAYYFKQSSASDWTTKQSYSTTKSVTLKPSKKTTYNIKVNVKDSNGTVTSKTFNVTVK